MTDDMIMMTFLTSFSEVSLQTPRRRPGLGRGRAAACAPRPPPRPAPRTPDTRGWSDTSRAAIMRTGGHTFGYFIQLYPSYNFQLQHEELAEVEQGGAVGRGLSSARSSCSVAANS